MVFECTVILAYESGTNRNQIRDAAQFNTAMFDGHVESRARDSRVQFKLLP